MSKPIPSFLRLHVERLPEPLPRLADGQTSVERLCQAFGQATGWSLAYEPLTAKSDRAAWSRSIAGGSAASSGVLSIEPAPTNRRDRSACGPALELDAATDLADALGDVLTELERTRHALWQREAELAAGVPVAAREGSERHLAERLEAVLQGGATAVGCQAAGLYLLDEGTSELKLRAAWGLPQERLLEPARPLRGALADLEALVGHAVVLEDVAVLPHWKAPENFPSAVCIPVANAITPLGTLWVFSEQQRDFTSEQTNLLEIVAGRIASDLEREMLLAAGAQTQQQSRQMNAAAQWQQNRLPHAAPLLEGWQVAGWSASECATPQRSFATELPAPPRGFATESSLTAGFHDWLVHADGSATALLGAVAGGGLAAGLSAAALRAMVKAHATHVSDPAAAIRAVGESFAADSLGDEYGSLFVCRLAPEANQLIYAAAGNMIGWIVSDAGCQALVWNGCLLGPEFDPRESRPAIARRLSPGDALVVIQGPPNGRELALPTNLVCESLFDRRRQPAAVLVDAVRAALASQVNLPNPQTSVLVVKRRGT